MLRIGLIVAALVVAALTGWMVQRYLAAERELIAQSRPEPAAPVLPTAEVLVVTADVPVGGIVAPRVLAWQPWPEQNLNPRYVTRAAFPNAIEELGSAAARQPMFAGEPVTQAKLVTRKDAGFLSAILGEGKRAVSIPVDAAAGVSGLVLPGDYVDVVLTHKPTPIDGSGNPRAQQQVSETIARNLRVLAVDQTFKAADGESSAVGKTVTLEVTPAEAEAIFLGRSLGSLSLALRSAFGSQEEPPRAQPFTRAEDVSGAMRRSAAAPEKVALPEKATVPEKVVPVVQVSAPAPPPPPVREAHSILIYRGTVPQVVKVR